MSNPENTIKPKIFAFSNTVNGGDGEALAMAEDGTVLGWHLCSSEAWVSHDLGVTTRFHHDEYKAHYPNGFEMEFIEAADIDSHAGLQAASVLNKKQGEAARAAL